MGTVHIINLSTEDMTYGPSIIPTVRFEPHKEENLSTKDMTYSPSIIPTYSIQFQAPKEEVPLLCIQTHVSTKHNVSMYCRYTMKVYCMNCIIFTV